MPLTDSSVDLVIAVHSFEHATDAEEQMRELWRVAAPNARSDRRRAEAARVMGAGGQHAIWRWVPFSKGQLEKLLRDHSFVPEQWKDALYLPPSNHPLLLRSARFFERAGRLFGPALAGLLIVQARKELFPAVPRGARQNATSASKGFRHRRQERCPTDSPLCPKAFAFRGGLTYGPAGFRPVRT